MSERSGIRSQDLVTALVMQKTGAGISPFFEPLEPNRSDHENEEICAKHYISGGLIVCVLDRNLQPVFFKDLYQHDSVPQIPQEEALRDDEGWHITWWNIDRPPMDVSNFIIRQRRLADDAG